MNLPLFFKRVIYGASGQLPVHERTVLQAVGSCLPKEEADILQEQCQDVEMVQRTGGGRVVTLWFSKVRPPRRLPGEDEFCFARLRIEKEGRKNSVSVWVHLGEVRSIEYSRRPEKDFSVSSVEIRPKAAVSTAAALDRVEHR